MSDEQELGNNEAGADAPQSTLEPVWGTWPPTSNAPAKQPRAETAKTVAKILLIGDRALGRRSLRWELRLESSLEVVGEASSGAQGVALAIELHPDIVIMDMAMPDMDGFQAAEQLHALAPDCVIILLTPFDSLETHSRARAAGVRVVLEKWTPPILRSVLHDLAQFVIVRYEVAWPEASISDAA
jgi:CheY-like chemotaxis protein